MVMVTHIGDIVYCSAGRLSGWDQRIDGSAGLDFWLRDLRKNHKGGTPKRYHNEFNLIDEKLCQWKDSS